MPTPPDEIPHAAAALERISWELVRLRMEADSIGQPLLGFMLDQASVLAGEELAAIRLAAAEPPPSGPPRPTSALARWPEGPR